MLGLEKGRRKAKIGASNTNGKSQTKVGKGKREKIRQQKGGGMKAEQNTKVAKKRRKWTTALGRTCKRRGPGKILHARFKDAKERKEII